MSPVLLLPFHLLLRPLCCFMCLVANVGTGALRASTSTAAGVRTIIICMRNCVHMWVVSRCVSDKQRRRWRWRRWQKYTSTPDTTTQLDFYMFVLAARLYVSHVPSTQPERHFGPILVLHTLTVHASNLSMTWVIAGDLSHIRSISKTQDATSNNKMKANAKEAKSRRAEKERKKNRALGVPSPSKP